MSKNPGDAWTQIDRHYCPKCGKKGCYKKSIEGIPESYKCMYCKEWSYTIQLVAMAEIKKSICPVCKWQLNDELYRGHSMLCSYRDHNVSEIIDIKAAIQKTIQ